MSQTAYVEITGGVTAPQGFTAAGAVAGIKHERKDVALVYSDREASVAGVFTTNIVKAAPVLLTMEHIKDGTARAVVANSGNANACVGPRGLDDARAMVSEAAGLLRLPAEQVLVASTGVIGQPMPMDRVLSGVQRAVAELSREGGRDAAAAIMTTDTVAKEAAVTVELGGVKATIGGMAKGSGMIHPNMATMLCFITTDAAIDSGWLHKALTTAVERTFNMITVDGDTSTNDMVVALANGASGNRVINGEDLDYAAFATALEAVCRKLAVAVAADGEGATRLLEVQVQGAATQLDARLVARAVASSSLVKAAVFGKDANWGRVLCAAGYSGAGFDPDAVDIYVGDVQVAKNGGGLPFSEERAAEVLAGDRVVFTIDLHNGDSCATAWGCDLTYDYVRINGSYRT
ncbi:bifunctional glutamate N-acetyltransferase/amino-acid acetyltransferase ArgJ [Desulfoscipio gibsoniae]|uniref:Arginine biosynthesis bifunctional protein ArgJ n=1 Tax=Desulfoscipio gibsoniae DSM 7213 TaxID=767817 RepID=R4KEF4_9FIRM|nr:bifunctional glutamate N-acetyltransferase/amino-acid acetyltransferase ArgJ [Desulfoscipio gibsoniae]AGL00027.1 glutamate N-acetyltransferase/amino-acid acetyltransferase [Desulfoscipio gibsoniae DSM 7213]